MSQRITAEMEEAYQNWRAFVGEQWASQEPVAKSAFFAGWLTAQEGLSGAQAEQAVRAIRAVLEGGRQP